MRITWYGHAAFLIETAGSADHPRPLSIARLRGIRADRRARGPRGRQPRKRPLSQPSRPDRPAVRDPAGTRAAAGGRGLPRDQLRGDPRLRDPERLPEDEVTIVHFRAEGLHVVFLGDLGHPLSESELAPLRGADIVLAAAGGPPTIDCPEISAAPRCDRPAHRDPMHFKTPKINSEHPAPGRVPGSDGQRAGRTPRLDLDRGHANFAASTADDHRAGTRPLTSRPLPSVLPRVVSRPFADPVAHATARDHSRFRPLATFSSGDNK